MTTRPTRTAVHAVVSCANRKTQPVPQTLHLRHVVHSDTVRRARAWIGRLESASVEAVSALHLYAGEHWHVARRIADDTAARSVTPTLWVCSAGYGLVRADAPLRPYAATFAPRHLDSVGTDAGNLAGWWGTLASWPGPQPGAPRRLAELAEADPSSTLLVALSPAYLRACADDVLDAARALTSPDQLSVICLGWTAGGPLAEYVIPADARLQHTLGGTRQSLNTRLLSHLLAEYDGSLLRPALRRATGELLATLPPLRRYDRALRTDAQVRTFVGKRLRTEPTASCSRLLREYRDAGSACEQSRFRRLYDEVQGARA